MRRLITSILIFVILLTAVNVFAGENKSVKKLEFYIIANKSIEFDAVNYSELKDLYLGRNRKIKGEYILPAMYADSDCFRAFLKKVLSLDKREFDVIWKKAIFTGRGKPPKIFRSMEEIVNYVTVTRNAIGIVDKEYLSENVKVLKVPDYLSSSEIHEEEKIDKADKQELGVRN